MAAYTFTPKVFDTVEGMLKQSFAGSGDGSDGGGGSSGSSRVGDEGTGSSKDSGGNGS